MGLLIALLSVYALGTQPVNRLVHLQIRQQEGQAVRIANAVISTNGDHAERISFDVTNVSDLPISAMEFRLDSPNFRHVRLENGMEGVEDAGIMTVALCWRDCKEGKASLRSLKPGETMHLSILCTEPCLTPIAQAREFPPELTVVGVCFSDGSAKKYSNFFVDGSHPCKSLTES